MALRLALTGRPRLFDEAGETVRFPRKAFVLAAHLLLDSPKGPMPRDQAARLLWEDADPARRGGNLRQLLVRVKEAQAEAGIDLFLIEPDHVGIDPEAVTIDVVGLLKARADTTGRRLLELCRSYSGDLLTGIDEGGETFTRWLWSRRQMLREQFAAIVTANLETSIETLDQDEAIFVARRLIEADQYQEAGHRALMRVHAARGEFDTALRVHRRLVELLREINSRPTSETTALAAKITTRARGGSEEDAAAPAPVVAQGGILQLPRVSLTFPDLTDLVGLEREWATALYDDAAIQLWRTRCFVLTRATDLRAKPIDLVDRNRRPPSDYVVDCRIAVRDGRRYLTAGLVGTASGEILWIRRFDIGSPLARAVRELVVNCVHHIEQAELRALAASPERTTAYRLTLQGNRLLRSIDLPSIRRARQIFRTALSADPEHGPTLAAISKAYRLEWLRLARADDKELDLAIDFARQAIAAMPDSAQGMHQFGICNIYKKNHEQGLEALARAEGLMPFEEELLADHADGLISSGFTLEGLGKVNPLVANQFVASDHFLWITASGQYLAGRYEEALTTLSQLSSQEPTYQLRAACHAMLDQRDEAKRYVNRLRDILPDFTVASRLGMVPLRRREDLERYESGLRSAGFD